MKKIFNILLVAIAAFFTACSNEAIEIETSAGKVKNAVTMTVSPSNFVSSYNYVDTKHGITGIADDYRTFHSEYNGLIAVRSYFYDKSTGVLADSARSFVETADNDVVLDVNLPVGDYYAISVICMAYGDKTPFWNVADREKLETAKLVQKNRKSYGLWNVLSVSTEEISVLRNSHVSASTVPAPVGSIIYYYLQNFQFKNQTSYGTVADNGIRRVSIYTRNYAVAYKLNPKATNKYEYLADAGANSWYIVEKAEPADFDEFWTYFQSNLYGYAYFLAPEASMTFGYTLDGETTFKSYGETTKQVFQPGKVYLGYWDYFKVGNPYLGIADNKHWNSYTTNARSYASMKTLPGNIWSK